MILIKKIKKTRTNFEPTGNTDVTHKCYLDEKLFQKTVTYPY